MLHDCTVTWRALVSRSCGITDSLQESFNVLMVNMFSLRIEEVGV